MRRNLTQLHFHQIYQRQNMDLKNQHLIRLILEHSVFESFELFKSRRSSFFHLIVSNPRLIINSRLSIIYLIFLLVLLILLILFVLIILLLQISR